MTLKLYLRKEEAELRINSGIGIVMSMEKEEIRTILYHLGSHFSEATIQCLFDKAEEENLLQ